MTAIGIDTHKATLAACRRRVRQGARGGEFDNDPAGHRGPRGLGPHACAGRHYRHRGLRHYGAAAARWLVGEGFSVCEVPPQLSRRERRRIRRPGKSDPGDAFAIARVTDETSRAPAGPPGRPDA